MAHLRDEFYIESLPIFDQLAALVMVFDINDVSQLLASCQYVYFLKFWGLFGSA